jgi:broad specificity phosphatase PhoE
MSLRKLILIRHGETDGLSSVRYYGSTDIDLSPAGRAQMRSVAAALRHQEIDLWAASSLQRSWKSAMIASGGASVRIERDLREIHFGSWEGLTAEEIQARDPVRFEDWQAGGTAFEYPGGEPRTEFRDRVAAGLASLNASGARSIACVLHKGVIREIVRALTGVTLPRREPAIGATLEVTRTPSGEWIFGSRSSNPEGLEEAAA